MRKFTAFLLITLLVPSSLSLEPIPYSINTKKWSHVLDDHFISITINPTDLLQGRVFGLTMNSTMAILKGLAPAYIRIGSADTAKYTFKKTRHPNDMIKPEDEYTVTESHWMVFNEVAQSAGLNVIVCLNAAHRIEGTKKWDTRNSLELISFSDSQGYNLTWQLGYEIQSSDDLSGIQFGKDLNRLRTILNAFPRYQHSKLIGPDIKIIHKKEDVDFWNDVLVEAGPTLDAVTWHPRWPQPSKMKVSENSELGYEFPVDYLEWDKIQLNKILQRTIFKNPVWIGETKRESTGTFAEGLIWAKRLALAAKIGVEVVMKQPNLMDITHPKPEYWIALLHKRLLGKAVLETRSVSNNTDVSVISHCTNPYYWTDKPEKLQDGPITIYGINMGGLEQKIQIKGILTGRSQLVFQYVLTSGTDPDSVFSQMTYLNGEPLMMTDEGMLPPIIPKIKKFERSLSMKLPPYSIGFWVVPEAKVKICQVQTQNLPTVNIETMTPSAAQKSPQNTLKNIEDINQFMVEKLKNPEGESTEIPEIKIEDASSESTEKELNLLMRENNNTPRIARKIRQVKTPDEIQQLKAMMLETQNILSLPHDDERNERVKMSFLPKPTPEMEQRIYKIAEGISDAMKTSNQQHEFDKFLEDSGLKQDFGSLLVADRRVNAPGSKHFQPYMSPPPSQQIPFEKMRLKRSADDGVESSEEYFSKFEKLLSIEDEGEKEEGEGIKKEKGKKNLVIQLQPDLKGLEEKYKAILQIKLEDSKRKFDDLKKKLKQNGTEISSKINSLDDINIEEEIIKKEIELITKAEETVADIFNSQKKRQETIEDMIFDELNDVKDERMNALADIQKNNKKKDNIIHKRQTQTTTTTPLSRPLSKTVEYIEKNFNLEPESVKKIKRSLEEKMGEILKNYDMKKSSEVKKRNPSQREERKLSRRMMSQDESGADEEKQRKLSETSKSSKHSETDRDGVKVRNTMIRKPLKIQNGSSSSRSSIRKHSNKESNNNNPNEKETEEHITKTKKSQKNDEMENDSFELFNAKKFEIPEQSKKTERKHSSQYGQETRMKHHKKIVTDENPSMSSTGKISDTVPESESKLEKSQDSPDVKNKENNDKMEDVPIKLDKNRRETMLKQISSIVDNMHSMEKDYDRLKRMNYDEDLSTEFEPDRRSSRIIRRPRQADDVITVKDKIDIKEKFPSLIKDDDDNVKIDSMKKIQTMTDTDEKVIQNYDKPLMDTVLREKTPINTGEINKNPQDGTLVVTEKMEEKVQAAPMTTTAATIITTTTPIPTTAAPIITTAKPTPTTTTTAPPPPPSPSPMMQPTTTSSPSIEAISPPKKRSRVRRLRKRPNRKPKTGVAEGGEEGGQKKRHLLGIERPHYDAEKKKLLLPKLRKINPKFARFGNDFSNEKKFVNLLKNDEKMLPKPLFKENMKQKAEEIQIPTSDPVFTNRNEQLLKDIQKIVNEEHFLDQNSKIENEKSKKNGNEFSKENTNSMVLPQQGTAEDYMKMMSTTTMNEMKDKESGMMKSSTDSFLPGETNDEKKKKIITEPDTGITGTESEFKVAQKPPQTKIINENKSKEKIQQGTTESVQSFENIDFWSEENSAEVIRNSSEEGEEDNMVVDSENTQMKKMRSLNEQPFNGSRKRRATFLNGKKNDKENDSEDYSSEERIKRFKQMVYRKAPNSPKRTLKNDVHSISNSLGADEFLRMAGSTVRVMFDDVIPEAYGQTKSKIQNMGLSEYIKEFGNLVQQMRNLDQIFLNIGEAAVKGYIRGNKPEKGPYIQVISRKKRDVGTEQYGNSEENPWNESANDDPDSEAVEIKIRNLSSLEELDPMAKYFKSNKVGDGTYGSSEGNYEYATTSTQETITDTGRRDNWNVEKIRNGIGTMVSSDIETGKIMEPNEEKTLETIQKSATTVLEDVNGKSFPKGMTTGKRDVDHQMKSKTKDSSAAVINGQNKKTSLKNQKKLSDNQIKVILQDKAVTDWLNSYIKDDLKENITPWIRTTKDFIQQALTTLQRQRQLSEILKKDANHKIKESQKNVGKREIIDGEPSLPVYHMISPSANKKRETKKQTEESLIRHLRELQPGVYVVPTDDMTNVRSEQFTNEAKEKTGVPNVVTLNIYYDKKNQGESEKGETNENVEPRISQDTVTYYQNKAWNSVASHYDQNNQFVSPIGVQEMPINGPIVAPVHVSPVFAPDPRIAEPPPNSRLIQYPATNYHYPPTQKIITSVVPNSHPLMSTPVLYVQPEATFIPQTPESKSRWRNFKVPGSGLTTSSNFNSGWNLQYGTPSSNSKKIPKSKLLASSYNPHFKSLSDKKRSVGDFKVTPTWSESALPFWKFFRTSSDEDEQQQQQQQQMTDNVESVEEIEKEETVDELNSNSSKDIFAENRKRAKEASKMKMKNNDKDIETETAKESETKEFKEKEPEEGKKDESRRKRSVDNWKDFESGKKLTKRSSYPYGVDFQEHDILPQWFGTYQQLDNTLDDFAPHVRRSHIVSTPWSDEEEELLTTLLEADDDLGLFDLPDEDYYFSNDNALPRYRRHPRSTDVKDGPIIKTNMILKSSSSSSKKNDNAEESKTKGETKTIIGLKSLTGKDASLEMMPETKIKNTRPTPFEIKKKIEQQIQQQQQQTQQKQPQQQQQQTTDKIDESNMITNQIPIPPAGALSMFFQPVQFQPSGIFMPNDTSDVKKIQNDEAFYYFFKYAYDSFVRVMKSMTELF